MLSSTGLLQAATTDLDRYHSGYVYTFLCTYDTLIANAEFWTAEWPDMDEEERVLQRADVMSDWSKRITLGQLYRAGRLTADESERLAELDRALLENAPHIEIAYGPSLVQLIQNLMQWGTPLAEMDSQVRLDFPTRALPALAQALAATTK